MNPESAMATSLRPEAEKFLEELFRAVEHGDQEHRSWLRSELEKWEGPLAKLLSEAYQWGVESSRGA